MTWGEHPDKSYPTTLKDCFALAGKTRKGGGDNDRHGIIVLYLEGMPLEGGQLGKRGISTTCAVAGAEALLGLPFRSIHLLFLA